jgi:hypothetical protein
MIEKDLAGKLALPGKPLAIFAHGLTKVSTFTKNANAIGESALTIAKAAHPIPIWAC